MTGKDINEQVYDSLHYSVWDSVDILIMNSV